MNKPGQTYVRSNLQSRNPHEMFFLFLLVHEHTFIAVPYSDQKGGKYLPELELQEIWTAHCECWELNSDHLGHQPVCLTTKSCPQTTNIF